MLPIVWNLQKSEWEVKDKEGNVLWHTPSYANAAQFASDYIHSSAIKTGLK